MTVEFRTYMPRSVMPARAVQITQDNAKAIVDFINDAVGEGTATVQKASGIHNWRVYIDNPGLSRRTAFDGDWVIMHPATKHGTAVFIPVSQLTFERDFQSNSPLICTPA